MPLLDHFHPPLSERRHRHAFHYSWATYLSSQLNALLPAEYFAETNVQYGIEVDVAAFEELGAAGAPAGWLPPPPLASLPFEMSAVVVEVGIFSRSGGPQLAGAVELVSPGNKDRPQSREAFVSKCHTYLQAGVGLVIVDGVPERAADLHRDLLLRLGLPDAGPGPALSASAFRPVEREVADPWKSGERADHRGPSLAHTPVVAARRPLFARRARGYLRTYLYRAARATGSMILSVPTGNRCQSGRQMFDNRPGHGLHSRRTNWSCNRGTYGYP